VPEQNEDQGNKRPRICCWINQGHGTDWVVSLAMGEDGMAMGAHVSSSDGFAVMDSGYAEAPEFSLAPAQWGPNLAKRERFAEHYPDGYDLEWAGDPARHPGLLAAYELNQTHRRSAAA
jgi:hypothetical protein